MIDDNNVQINQFFIFFNLENNKIKMNNEIFIKVFIIYKNQRYESEFEDMQDQMFFRKLFINKITLIITI